MSASPRSLAFSCPNGVFLDAMASCFIVPKSDAMVFRKLTCDVLLDIKKNLRAQFLHVTLYYTRILIFYISPKVILVCQKNVDLGPNVSIVVNT